MSPTKSIITALMTVEIQYRDAAITARQNGDIQFVQPWLDLAEKVMLARKIVEAYVAAAEFYFEDGVLFDLGERVGKRVRVVPDVTASAPTTPY